MLQLEVDGSSLAGVNSFDFLKKILSLNISKYGNLNSPYLNVNIKINRFSIEIVSSEIFHWTFLSDSHERFSRRFIKRIEFLDDTKVYLA